MLKPLLPSIPSKELLIEGKHYRVYEQVCLRIRPKQTVVYFSLANNCKQRHIKTFPLIRGICEKDKAIHLYIEDILSEFHDYIEKHYQGDRLRYSDLKEKYYLFQRTVSNGLYVCVSYSYYTQPGLKQTNMSKYIGRVDTITEKYTNTKVQEALRHQRRMNSNYNDLLAAKRKAFREQVDKEIQERDALC